MFQVLPKPTPCKTCGSCPTCGRVAAPAYPLTYPRNPFWQQQSQTAQPLKVWC